MAGIISNKLNFLREFDSSMYCCSPLYGTWNVYILVVIIVYYNILSVARIIIKCGTYH